MFCSGTAEIKKCTSLIFSIFDSFFSWPDLKTDTYIKYLISKQCSVQISFNLMSLTSRSKFTFTSFCWYEEELGLDEYRKWVLLKTISGEVYIAKRQFFFITGPLSPNRCKLSSFARV